MGLFDRVNPFDDSPEEPDVDIDTEFIDGGGEIDTAAEPQSAPDTQDDDGGDEAMEWENAYEFARWGLEKRGFASVTDFAERAAFERVKDDPMYRDRLESGVETLATVNEAKRQIDEISGRDTGTTDYEELADKMENADRVITSVRSLSGEDEVMVQQGMNLARDVLGAVADQSGGNSDVDTTMERSQEEI